MYYFILNIILGEFKITRIIIVFSYNSDVVNIAVWEFKYMFPK